MRTFVVEWWNPARWKIPHALHQLIDTQESCFLLVANMTGDVMLQSAQEETNFAAKQASSYYRGVILPKASGINNPKKHQGR